MSIRKDNKGRILKENEFQQADGRYFYCYYDFSGKRCREYSWKLVDTDTIPEDKRNCLSLREKKKYIDNNQVDLLKYNDTLMRRSAIKHTVEQPCYVYVICDTMGSCKIGVASNVQQRLKQIQTGNPYKCEVVKQIKLPSKNIACKLEKLLHEYFKSYQSVAANEWYKDTVLQFL